MLKTTRILIAVAIGALAVPALAGSWPNIPGSKAKWTAKPAVTAPRAEESSEGLAQYRYFPSEEFRGSKSFAAGTAAKPATASVKDGFEFVGGDAGWQLAQHKYVLSGGRFAHSEECDHARRTALAPTLEEVDAARRLSPGT